jgi:hypothetical protein
MVYPKTELDELMPVVYDELRRLAQKYLSRERSNHTNYREVLKIRQQLSAAAASDVFLRRDVDEALMKMRSVDKSTRLK